MESLRLTVALTALVLSAMIALASIVIYFTPETTETAKLAEMAEPAELAEGDTQLRSGSIVRNPGMPTSVKAYRQRLQNMFSQLRERKETSLPPKTDVWTLELDVKSQKGWGGLRAICDEYARYILQPRMRPVPPNMKKLTITMKSSKTSEREICEYDIKKRLLLSMPDGTSLLRNRLAPETLNLSKLKPVWIMALSRTKRGDIALPVADYLVMVPVQLSNRAELSRYLIATAKELYSRNKKEVLRFHAFFQRKVGSIMFPGYSVMAFRGAGSKISLIEEIKLKIMGVQNNSGTKARSLPVYVEVRVLNTKLAETVFNTKLAEINASGPGATQAEDPVVAYMKDALYGDAHTVIEAAGRYAADQFEASKIVIVFRGPFRGARTRLQIPIILEKHGDKWEIINRAK